MNGHRTRGAPARVAGAVVLALVTPWLAAGQGVDPAPRARRITVSAGAIWEGGYGIGESQAGYRPNAIGAQPPYTLFRAESSFDAVAGGEARLGYALSRALTVEVGVAITRRAISVSLSADDEVPAAAIQGERVSQLVVDVGAVWQLPGPAIGRRLRPFVSASAGYLRQLYDERTLVETGRVIAAGGGVRYWLRGGDASRHAIGLRGDIRAVWRVDGVGFDGRTHVGPTASATLFWEP